MMIHLSIVYWLIFLWTGANATGIGEAWQITPHTKSIYTDLLLRPRFDSSAFEVRTVSGVGRLAAFNEFGNTQKRPEVVTLNTVIPAALSNNEELFQDIKKLENFRRRLEDSSCNEEDIENETKDNNIPIKELLKTQFMMRLLQPDEEDDEQNETKGVIQRIRREADNDTKMEKISTTKTVREARLNSPETWSSSVQPISVEFRHRIPLDQVVQQQQEEEEALANGYRRHQAPRADFVTSHYRRSYPESRESRDMPIIRNYDDYELPWYRNAIRERDYEYPWYRRGYQYPDRYRMDRDYYMRSLSDQYYNRYREDDFDIYGKSRSIPKPKRIIYYATLPEIVRKPVDLRNYPRPYDASTTKSTVTRDNIYKRIPGNIDPSRYRYRHLYDTYDPFTKRSSYHDRSYGYTEGDSRRIKASTKESLRDDAFGTNSERKVSNLIAIKDEQSKLPWPIQIGTEVSIKDDERIPGRKIFGENNGYERFQNAQLQKAPDTTGSSELQSDN